MQPTPEYLTDKPGFSKHVEELGGVYIFCWRLARLISCAILLGLSAYTLVLDIRRDGTVALQRHSLHTQLLGIYTYTFLVAIASVACNAVRSRAAANHSALVLLALWAVFFYRDIWPLMTYRLIPLDAAEGWLIWIKVGVLTFAGVVVPLLVPRQYIPVDPTAPSLEPNPEQTACILSMALHSFLDPVIFLGYRVAHLSSEQLPPLADYDYAKNVAKRSFPNVDPLSTQSRKHIFFGLIKTYYLELMVMSLMMILRVICSFAVPIGIYRLLNYLSGNGQNDIVRPWVWIVWLVLGPLLSAILMQWYIFVASRMRVQLLTLFTHLLFEHILRVRGKAETNSSSSHGRASSNVASEAHSTDVTPTSSYGPRASNFAGKLNNLVTTDVNNLAKGIDLLWISLYIPLSIVLSIWFLYTILSWSALVGMLVIVLMFPIPGYIARVIQTVEIERAKRSDSRVQTITESMNVIRMVKFFAWEPRILDQIAEKRENELDYIKRFKLLEMSNSLMNFTIPLLTMVLTFMTYTLIMKQELTAARVFSSMPVFQMLQESFYKIFSMMPTLIQAKVSLDRVNDFLLNTELLPLAPEVSSTSQSVQGIDIGVCQAMFTWNNDNDSAMSLEAHQHSFILRIETEVVFKREAINLIVGPTGSGKTSLLMALLGEMYYHPIGPDSYLQLSRDGGIAYAAQESWLLNDTIRGNILFGTAYDQERYDKVISQCALKHDLELFDAGDMTEVGEKGLTLSGGQKARITLARAIYSPAKILLLDDVLAALDVHTARWVVTKCFNGDLVRGRTVLLVTHNVHLAKPVAQYMVVLAHGGTVKTQGPVSSTMSNQELVQGFAHAEEHRDIRQIASQLERSADIVKKPNGKLAVAEEISLGQMNWATFRLYFRSLGGRSPVIFWMLFLGGVLLNSMTDTFQAWYLGYWAEQYEGHDPSEVDVVHYITIYTSLLLFLLVAYLISRLVFVYGCLRASRTIHKYIVTSVLGTTFRWLDITPISRVITRCTQDIQAVDSSIPTDLGALVEMTSSMLLKFIGVIVISPQFLLPGIVVAILGGWCGRLYMKSQLSVKRELSNHRAPVLAHVGATTAGLVSIRAYGAQDAFKQESMRRIDLYSRPARMFYNLNRWVSIRIEALAGLFAATLAAYLVYGGRVTASDTGFSLTMAVGFSNMILWWIRTLNAFEVDGNSLERIQQYIAIEQEPKPSSDGVPPAHWPTSGDIVIENLSARYSLDGPRVLQDVSIHIEAGERVGIVGRTGSGKSSFSMALLRCIITEGSILYDGIPIDSLNLQALRSNITIIPQVPELLNGSLRENLDPLSEHDDATLNDVLNTCGLFSLPEGHAHKARLTLDSLIASGGGNLSVGERQILALARAILRRSKLLILDEATSAIDYETDTIIQTSLREQLDRNTTVLIIAHRLQTIMDADKIMVLDAGRLAEYGTPSELLKKDNGMLRTLVNESEDKERLISMAVSNM